MHVSSWFLLPRSQTITKKPQPISALKKLASQQQCDIQYISFVLNELEHTMLYDIAREPISHKHQDNYSVRAFLYLKVSFI